MKKVIVHLTAAAVMIIAAIFGNDVQAQSYVFLKSPLVADIPTSVNNNRTTDARAIDNVSITSAAGQLTIHFSKDNTCDVDVAMYDITGRRILKDHAATGQDDFSKTYSLDMPHGIVIIELLGNGERIVKKAMI